MALGLYANDRSVLKPMLREIKETGAEYVSFVVSWHQQNIWSAGPEPNSKSTISDQLVVDLIKEAHRLGLRVFLFPIIDVEDRKVGEWRGTLKPPNLEEWFRRYDKFILHYAVLAAKHRVDLFSVGSELIAFDHRLHVVVGQASAGSETDKAVEISVEHAVVGAKPQSTFASGVDRGNVIAIEQTHP